MKKDYSKYMIFTDRFPYIIFVLIIVMALIFVFQFMEKFPMRVFSASAATTTIPSSTSYNILLTSPSQDAIFDFPNKNAYVPIEAKFKGAEEVDYKLNLLINDGEVIKTFSSPPYKHNWNPSKSGEYSAIANLVDDGNKILSSSNKVRFVVNLKSEEEVTDVTEEKSEVLALTTEDTIEGVVPTVNLKISEGPVYSEGGDLCYYRVRAIVTGDPKPVIYFSKDDSGGAWGQNTAQVNLKNGESYDLVVTAVNSIGTSINHVLLAWGK